MRIEMTTTDEALGKMKIILTNKTVIVELSLFAEDFVLATNSDPKLYELAEKDKEAYIAYIKSSLYSTVESLISAEYAEYVNQGGLPN